MFHSSAIPDRRPFAPSALPEINAPIGASDFRSPPPPSSLTRLVRRCALLPAPAIGSPRLPRTLIVRLDAELRSRGGSFHSPEREGNCCLQGPRPHWPIHQVKTDFGTNSVQGQHHLLPLHLASFRAYASSTPLPEHLPGSIPGPWLGVTWTGFAPARLRDSAKSQPGLQSFTHVQARKFACLTDSTHPRIAAVLPD
jgi:hypothetical protein